MLVKTAGKVTWIDERFIYKQKKKYEALELPLAKWVWFCEVMMSRGFRVSVYDAKSTVSKYVRVHKGKRHYQVRFSNHKPNRNREERGDCDFFVGVTNLGVTRTEDAIEATLKFFGEDDFHPE